MAAQQLQESWRSSLAEFLAYCERRVLDNNTLIEAVRDHVSKTELATTAHIKPHVFLIDHSSAQTLDEQRNSATTPESSANLNKKEQDGEDVAARESKKLRSGRILMQDNNVGDLDQADAGTSQNGSHGHGLEVSSGGDDADFEYQDDRSHESGDDDLTIGAAEIRELMHDDDDGNDDLHEQEREATANDRHHPENYIAVEGYEVPVPIWRYLGRECTQAIVELLEAKPIEQPENCRTQLKPWQLTGVGKLKHLFETRHKGGILGDEQGLGKSLEAITAMVEDIVANQGKPYRGFNLIVTTKSCAQQWIDEIKKHYGSEMAKKAFFLNDAKVTANELLDGEYNFVVCTWQFVMSRYASYRKNIDFFRLLAMKGKKWVDENLSSVDHMPLNGRHVNALFSHVYDELGFPIRHLVLDEAQFAKNVLTKTYDAVRHLHYERIMLLSGTFLANRWYDIFGFVSLIPGHPFKDFQQFMKTFAHREENGYYSSPSVSKRNRLVKFLMSFTVARPVSVLKLPHLSREYHDFQLTDDEEAEVAFRVEKYLMLMSFSGRQQVFQPSNSDGKNKALQQAVLAQLQCANRALIPPGKAQVSQHLLSQYARLKDRFATARKAAGGTVTMQDLLAMITPDGMTSKQITSVKVAEELLNVSLHVQQGETAEIEGDVPEDSASNNQARTEESLAEDPDSPAGLPEILEQDDSSDYKSFKWPEERKDWLARLAAIPDSELLSRKVLCILDLMSNLRSNYPGERIIVFSKYLKFLDMLGEAMRRSSTLSDTVPLQFNGTLNSHQRSFSQKSFNDENNKRPIFVTAGSGGAGLNLTGGSQIIQCEPWWNPNDENQAQSRAWRMGQTKDVHVYVIRGINSLIDYIIQQCQNIKAATNTGIMGPLRREDDSVAIIPRQYQGGIGER
ncbi:hypothetical protein A1O7_07462 [Cladophialophora yegresii CBS 114405]|uniref:Helicase C-terminal domain-containing protein n=1 Tax=Cladophialophora yegresii CBS 114405 TaxID=1182544 RepID=W9VNK7_9EURO|nr:uncharacterized protein A1O7_07462 [Cladophialophora yegresii CBS 114405]EXJ57118.1 hypothetical protein A1O7_07462 [Cladophialophora yegresii CBS 114405]